MQQTKASKSLPARMPRSAGRPRSAGTTRTKSFFDTREGKVSGKDENVDVAGPSSLPSNDEIVPPLITGDNDDAALQFPPLGNLDCDNDIFEWETTRTMKPRDAFDMQVPFSLFGIMNLCMNLTGRMEMGAPSETFRHHNDSLITKGEEISSAFKPPPFETHWLAARGPVHFCFLVLNSIVAYLLTCYRSMARFIETRNDHTMRHINEDRSQIYAPIVRASNLARVEERLTRELELEGKSQRRQSVQVDQESASASHDVGFTAFPEREANSVVMDKSYWSIPGQDLVGPKKRSGNVQSEVELAIDIGQIKFSHNQGFNAQEQSLARVSCLYDQYRMQMDASTVRTSVTKVTEICQQLRSIHDERERHGKAPGDSRPAIISLFNDLKTSTISLVTESESIKYIAQQMKQGWKEFLGTRDNSDSYYADVVLMASMPYVEVNNDLKKLAEEMKSTKPVLSRMISDEELRPSSVETSQMLQNVECVLSDTNHIVEVMELIQPSQRRDSGKVRLEKAEKYFARLLINRHVVGDTKTEQLDRLSFSVGLSHRFNCLMLQKPTETCIQIWKASIGFLPDALVCTCFFSIQYSSEFSNSSDEGASQGTIRLSDGDWLQFSSEDSGVKGKIWLATRVDERVVTRPTLAIRTSKLPMHDLLPVHHSTRLIMQGMGSFDPSQRLGTSYKPRIRPCTDRQSTMEFRHASNGILFSNKRVFEEPLRHVLIQRRQRNPSLGPSLIPITELEVQSTDAFHDMVKSDVDTNDEGIVHNAIAERPYVNKLHIMDVLRRIREYSQRSCVRKYHFAEIIQDVSIYRTFPQLFSLTIPPRKRSLYPKSTHCLPVKSRTQSSSLLLTVVGGRNVPQKLDGDNVTIESTGGEEVLKNSSDMGCETCVGVLVKIWFRGKRYHTKYVNCGSSSPQWKETFCIPLCDKLEEIYQASLVDEVVHLSLFDCTTVDLKHMGGFYEDEESMHSELRYLGHVSFPLGIVLREGNLNGFVHCHSPHFVVGYIKGNGETNDNEGISAMERSHEVNSYTMLHIHMTTEPLIVIPPNSRLEFPSIENEFILSRLTAWTQNHFDVGSVLWPDSEVRSNLASRFLTEQVPPPGFNTLPSCSFYVSLIPSDHLVNWRALKGRDENMTLSSQQFVNILVGTRREHSILLTNFFLALSKGNPDFAADVFLAVGFSIPEGATTFVVRRCKKTREVVLWDAITGRAYPQPDNSCPLQKIHCLVSKDNIYRNVEADKSISVLDFNVSDVRKWAPLHIDGASKNATFTMQDERLHFALPDHHRAREIQIELCASIQSSIRGWRHMSTCFRTDINAKMASKLEQLENAKLNGLPMSNIEMSLHEGGISQSRMSGFMLHEPFTSVQDILDRVKATEIHRNRNPRVEYVVSARAFAYPGGVISVWVCVCSVKES